MHPDSDEYLGVDFGSARVGIARGSGHARLAEPLVSVNSGHAIESLAKLSGEHKTAAIVVGLPRGLDGQETAQTKAVRDWAQQAKQRLNLPLYWQDEALTSHEAARTLKRKSKTVNGTDEHAAAAAIILQDFLDTPVNNRVKA